MGKLATVGGSQSTPAVVLLGSHGVGKTTFGSESPRPVFITTEDGASRVVADRVAVDGKDVIRNWTDFDTALNMVLTEDHEYNTLVIDTLNGASGLLAQFVCKTQYGGRWAAEKGQRSYLSFGEGPKSTAEEAKAMLNSLDAIRHSRGMNILLLTHVGVQNIRNPRLGDYHRFAGDMAGPIWNVFAQWSDIIALADYDMAVVPRDSGFKGAPGIAKGTTTRVLRCGGSVAEDTKCRAGYEIPELMEFDAADFWSTIGKDPTAVAEVKDGWSLLTKEQQKATMDYLGTKKIEDAPIRKLRRIVERMRVLRVEKAQQRKENTDE